MSNILALATYGLVRGDAGLPRRPDPNTSAAATAHRSHAANQSRTRAAQLLQADLAPPMMAVQDMSLDRHLGNRYVPHQVPFATLSCAAYLSVHDVQGLARIFEKYNVLPNNENAEVVNDPELVDLAFATGRDRVRRGEDDGAVSPLPLPAPVSDLARSTTATTRSASVLGVPVPAAATASAGSVLPYSPSSPPQPSSTLTGTNRMSQASRGSAARVLETKLTRDEDDHAICAEWLVELLLDIIAARMEAETAEAEVGGGKAKADIEGRVSPRDGVTGRRGPPSARSHRRPSHPRTGGVDATGSSLAQRAARLRVYRGELLAWVAPLAQDCDARRQATVYEGCRRQQRMLLQYHRGMLEAELLRAKRGVEALPQEVLTDALHEATSAVGSSRTGKGFGGAPPQPLATMAGTGPSNLLPQALSNGVGGGSGGLPASGPAATTLPSPQSFTTTVNNNNPSTTRRSPAAINFLVSLDDTGSAPPARALVPRGHGSDILFFQTDGDDDVKRSSSAPFQSPESSIASPLTLGSRATGGGTTSRGAAALAVLDTLLPVGGGGGGPSSPTVSGDVAATTEEPFFLATCYVPFTSRREAAHRGVALPVSAAEASRRRARLSVTAGSPVTSMSAGDWEEFGGSRVATRPPSASVRGAANGGPSSSTVDFPRERRDSTTSTAITAATLPVPAPPVLHGRTWLEVISDLPTWTHNMREHLNGERCALGTQTLEDVVLSLAATHANGVAARHHPHHYPSKNQGGGGSGVASGVTSRATSFRRPPGHARLARLPKIGHDTPCRVVCWTDFANNLILDYEGNEHQSGFLEQAYVRGPSVMLEGDDANRQRGDGGCDPNHPRVGDVAGGEDDEAEETDENNEEALLSTIHGGARRRRAAGRRTLGGGGAAAPTTDDIFQQTAMVADMETFADELKGLHRQSADHVVVTANGQLIITASKDGIVKSWEGRFGQFRSNLLNVGASWVLSMSLLRDDQLLLVATSNAELTLVELATGSVVHKYRGCTSLLTALRAVTQPDAHNTAKYGMKPGECGPHKVPFESGTSAEGYHGLREREVALTRQSVQVAVQPIEGFVAPSAFYLSADTSLGFFGTCEGVTGCIDLSGELRRSATLVAKGMTSLGLLFSTCAHAPGTTVVGVCYSSSAGCVVSVGRDGSLTRIPLSRDGQTGVYTVGDAASVYVVQPKPIRFIAFYQQGRLLATAHSDRRVQLWSLTRTSVELVHQFPQETHDIVSMVFLPKEERLAMLLADHSVRVFDVRGYRPSAIVTTRSTSDQQLQDMASVTLKLSAVDDDGCVAYHAPSRRLIVALRSPVIYLPTSGPRIEGSRRELAAAEKLPKDALPAKRGSRASSPSITTPTGTLEKEQADRSDNDGGSGSDEANSLTALQTLRQLSVSSQLTESAAGGGGELTSGLLSRRESLELVELVERRQRERLSARAAKRQQREAEALLARRLAPHTTHHRGGVVASVLVAERREVHTFTSDRWKVWCLETGALLRECEVPREVRLAFPRFRRATYLCAGWSTMACTRLLLGGYDGVLTTLDPEAGVVVMTEQLHARPASSSTPIAGTERGRRANPQPLTGHTPGTTTPAAASVPAPGVHLRAATTTTTTTAPNAASVGTHTAVPGTSSAIVDRELDVTVITSEKQWAFLCMGRHCVVRKYQTNALDAHGAEAYTSLTVSLPAHMTTTITACCTVRDTHVCLGTMDGHLLFYRLADQSAPYAEEMLRESYPDGSADVGSVIGLFFLNEKNQGLVIAVTDMGVMHVYAYLKGVFVARLRLCRAHECHITALHFHRLSTLLVLGDSLGRVRLFDLSAFVADSTNFKRAVRAHRVFQGATSDITSLVLMSRVLTPRETDAGVVAPSLSPPASMTVADGGATWLVVASSDGNARLFGLPRTATHSFTAIANSSTTTTNTVAVRSSTTGAAVDVGNESAVRHPARGFMESVTSTAVGADAVRAASTTTVAGGGGGADSNANRHGSTATDTKGLPDVPLPVLVGLFGCDEWHLGDDSSYSTDVSLPIQEVSTRQKESQAVLEEVLRRSKPTACLTSPGYASCAPTAGATTTTPAGAVSAKEASDEATAADGRTSPRTRAAPKAVATVPTAPTAAPHAVPSATPAITTVTISQRIMQSLLPTVKAGAETLSPLMDGLTLASAHGGEKGANASARGPLPASVALGSRSAQAHRTPLDRSLQRRIAPVAPDDVSHDDNVGSCTDGMRRRQPRRSTTTTGIASVLCGDGDEETSSEIGSGENSTTAAGSVPTRSRHQTLLLAAAAAAASTEAPHAFSVADATYTAAHRHMSGTAPNPLLRAYPVALLRKLGVLLPNQSLPGGEDEAMLPADLAFDPARLRAHLREGQRASAADTTPQYETATTPSQPHEACRSRRMTVAMGPSRPLNDGDTTAPSFFLTDVPHGEDGGDGPRLSATVLTSEMGDRARTPSTPASTSARRTTTGKRRLSSAGSPRVHSPTRTAGSGDSSSPDTVLQSRTSSLFAPTAIIGRQHSPHGAHSPHSATLAPLERAPTPTAKAAAPSGRVSMATSSGLPPRAVPPTPPSATDARDEGERTPFAATAGAGGLAGLSLPRRALPSAMRAASATTPRPSTRPIGHIVPATAASTVRSGEGLGDTAASAGGASVLHHGSPSVLLSSGVEESLRSPLTLPHADCHRAPLSAPPVDQKRREADTVAFPAGLPPVAVLEERRDQLMLAHLARYLDHLHPKGCADGAFTAEIEKSWRRRRGDAATRAAATGTAATSDIHTGDDEAGGRVPAQQSPTSAMAKGESVRSPSATRRPPSSSRTMSGVPLTSPRNASLASTFGGPGRVTDLLSTGTHTDGGGGYAGLDLRLLAHPTESSSAAAGRDDTTRGGRGGGTETPAASALPAHERMQQRIQQLRKAELQSLRDRLAAREVQESGKGGRRSGATMARSHPSTTPSRAGAPDGTNTATTAAATRPLPRGRDELPLISGRQRLEAIDVALPSTLTRDEGAKLQLRQLQALCSAGNHAPAELSASAPAPRQTLR